MVLGAETLGKKSRVSHQGDNYSSSLNGAKEAAAFLGQCYIPEEWAHGQFIPAQLECQGSTWAKASVFLATYFPLTVFLLLL